MARKVFCFILALLFFSTHTYAISGVKGDRTITENDLKQQYPDAQFYSITQEEFDALASKYKKSGNKADVSLIDYHLCDYETLTAARLKEKYPDADFKVTTINSVKVTPAILKKKRIIIAVNQTIVLTDKSKKLSFEDIVKASPGETFTVFYPETVYGFTKIKKGLEGSGSIIVMASMKKDSATIADEPASSPGGRHDAGGTDYNVSGACLADIPDLGSNDVAVVLFVVVGAFVVAALVVYGGKFIYDALIGKAEHEYSFELSPTATFFNRDRHNGVSEKGAMTGLKFVTNIDRDNLQVGLAAEAGNMNIELYHDDSGSLYKMNGFYWMAGPHLGFPFNTASNANNPSCFMLEVLAGMVEHEDDGFISAARAGITFGIKEHLRFGINVGSFYFDLDETEGILDLDKTDGIATDEDRFRLTIGCEIGYRF